MEKKVNLTIFFNYRRYSPRFKMLLEDVFYKKMHDEKLSSSDAMQQVMKFCNDVDEIEYTEFDSDILSRYIKEEKKIMINSYAVNKLSEEHRDLDEEALLKNILQKQTANVLSDTLKETFDVTFEDVLNRNGYVAPRKLSEINTDNESVSSTEESVIESIVTPRIATKSEIKSTISKNEDRFLTTDETTQVGAIQKELKEKLEVKKNSFKNFFPEDDVEVEDKLDEINDDLDYNYQKIGVLSRRYGADEKEPEDEYNLLDCIKRKDEYGSKFSDFVPEKEDEEEELGSKNKFKNLFSGFKKKNNCEEELEENQEDITIEEEFNNISLEDEEVEEKENKASAFLASMKNKMATFADKLKTTIAKKEQEENEFESDIFEEEFIDEESFEVEACPNNDEIIEEFESLNDTQQETTAPVDAAEYDFESTSNFVEDEKLDDKFDNIISAIMREKQKEIEEDELLAYDDSFEKESHMTSVYDAFAEELETVESVKKRRRR